MLGFFPSSKNFIRKKKFREVSADTRLDRHDFGQLEEGGIRCLKDRRGGEGQLLSVLAPAA